MRSPPVLPYASEPPATPAQPAPATAWQGVVPIPDDALRAIAAIRYLREYDDGIYRDLDIELTLDYMRRRFVLPLSRHVDISAATLLDCAAGFGWLAFAYLLAGGKHATLVEMSAPRLDAARTIAQLLGVDDRCSFRDERIQDIAIADNGADIFASIETLEHVGRSNVRASLANMARIANRAIILTTPNLLFPVVAHDTELPFAHWLPAGVRRRYASAAGRGDLDRGNQFLVPWDLAPLLAKFHPASRFQTFAARHDYEHFYPHYMPYGPRQMQRYRAHPRSGQRYLQMALAAMLGRYSFTLAPNLASLWLRRA